MISNFTITYKYVPSIEVLVVQNAIDKVGKLHELNITHVDITSNDGKSLKYINVFVVVVNLS